LKDFVNRWNKLRDLSVSPSEADRLEWEEKLNELGLNGRQGKPQIASSPDDKLYRMRDSGTRIQPPESLRRQFDAFRKALEKSSQ
jgi:hypothetical protein